MTQKSLFENITKIRDLDALLVVLDSQKQVTSEVQRNLALVKKYLPQSIPYYLVMNKMDLCFNRKRLQETV